MVARDDLLPKPQTTADIQHTAYRLVEIFQVAANKITQEIDGLTVTDTTAEIAVERPVVGAAEGRLRWTAHG